MKEEDIGNTWFEQDQATQPKFAPYFFHNHNIAISLVFYSIFKKKRYIIVGRILYMYLNEIHISDFDSGYMLQKLYYRNEPASLPAINIKLPYGSRGPYNV